jgi:hypothetical protein
MLLRPVRLTNTFCCFEGVFDSNFFVLKTCYKLKSFFTIIGDVFNMSGRQYVNSQSVSIDDGLKWENEAVLKRESC